MKHSVSSHHRGHILLELLVVIGIIAIIGSMAGQVILTSTIGNKIASEKNMALGLAKESFEAIRAVGGEKWQSISNLIKGIENYYPEASSGKWIITAGLEEITIGDTDFTRSFNIQNICRETIDTGNDGRDITGITDTDGASTTCITSGGSYDPSTQKILVTINWPESSLSESEYINRWANKTCNQTSWQTGGSSGVKTCPDTTYGTSTNITTGTDIQLCPGGC